MSIAKRTPWQVQRAVWTALYRRELKTRFGVYKLGYIWAIFEPVSHILVLTFIFSFISREGYQGLPFAVFFAAGIIPFFIFQKTISAATNAINPNKGLFTYRQVKPIDTVLVRSFIEFVTSVAALFFLIWLGEWFFGYDALPARPLEACYLFILLFLLSVGLGLICAVIGALWEEAAKLIPQVLRPMYFISGIFIPVQSLPEAVHKYILWNPILHSIEQIRASFFRGYDPGNTSSLYILLWTSISLLIGLWYFHINRIRILMQ